MFWPHTGFRHPRSLTMRRPGFTLLELMIAATITLVMMGAVVAVFGLVSTTINESRATMEMAERLRATAQVLQQDLAGITVPMMPPRDPEKGEGYFEYIEGPVGPVAPINQYFANTAYQPHVNTDTGTAVPDTTVGDNDDILMFTTRTKGEPFQGRLYVRERSTNATNVSQATNIIAKSSVAEVAWFVRGRTLYRRVLLVAPSAPIRDNSYTGSPVNRTDYPAGFYAKNDLSVRLEQESANSSNYYLVPNTLGDLTKRENRFAHCMAYYQFDYFPFDARRWCQLGLPTLLECSSTNWRVGATRSALVDALTYTNVGGTGNTPTLLANVTPQNGRQDLWSNNPNDRYANPYNRDTGNQLLSGSRYTEDVILNNVLGFDVKVWDPGAPIVAAGTTNALKTMALLPGEPGYIAALTNVTTPGSTRSPANPPLAFGAYVDLNYMCRLGPNLSYSVGGVVFPGYTYMPRYPYDTSGGVGLPVGWPAPWFHSAADVKYVPSTTDLTAATTTLLRWQETYLRGLVPILNGDGINPVYLPWRGNADSWRASVYDTFSTHYNRGGKFGLQPQTASNSITFSGRGQNGFDDQVQNSTYGGATGHATTDAIGAGTGNGIVDDEDEQEFMPPYRHPIKSIQVKIRAFEPSSRSVREVTVIQDFVPQ